MFFLRLKFICQQTSLYFHKHQSSPLLVKPLPGDVHFLGRAELVLFLLHDCHCISVCPLEQQTAIGLPTVPVAYPSYMYLASQQEEGTLRRFARNPLR